GGQSNQRMATRRPAEGDDYGIKRITDHLGVDTETGEKMIRQELWVKSRQKVKVVDVHNRKNIKHIKFRASREQKRLIAKLTDNELAFLTRLIPYLCWETNILIGDSETGEKGTPLSWAQIDKILLISKPTRIRIARSLESKNLIGYYMEDNRKIGIAINPKFAFNGYKPDQQLLHIFGLHKPPEKAESEGKGG
ncbi:hypothetical protein, partial [Brevibacillus sp. FSL L8-0710]|uniref:hypothetical protein n=2 Tax=Brevibacillus TaxID=55080 RepID=UPI0030F731F6